GNLRAAHDVVPGRESHPISPDSGRQRHAPFFPAPLHGTDPARPSRRPAQRLDPLAGTHPPGGGKQEAEVSDSSAPCFLLPPPLGGRVGVGGKNAVWSSSVPPP